MQIDLEPHEFRSPRTGKNLLGHLIYGLGCLGILGFIYWHRAEVTPDTLFGVSAMFGAFAGGFLIVWLNQFRGV